jgi:hypothetical protein
VITIVAQAAVRVRATAIKDDVAPAQPIS